MMVNTSTMWTCHWARRHVHRYLDADPSLPLTTREIGRLQAHLATCARCATTAEDFRRLREGPGRLVAARAPDPALVQRMHASVRDLVADDAR
jgi:anti-sigma factor RsiW